MKRAKNHVIPYYIDKCIYDLINIWYSPDNLNIVLPCKIPYIHFVYHCICWHGMCTFGTATIVLIAIGCWRLKVSTLFFTLKFIFWRWSSFSISTDMEFFLKYLNAFSCPGVTIKSGKWTYSIGDIDAWIKLAIDISTGCPKNSIPFF